MWNDLSISDKSRIILLAVLNGITSLSKIQLLYDSSVLKSDDYDYVGYYNKYPNDLFTHLEGQHYTDEFKLPSHPTFSSESIYSNRQTTGGNWSRISNNNGLLWNFTPSDWLLSLKGYLPKVIDYLIDAESQGVTLTDKYGRNPKIDGDLWGGVLPEVTVTSKHKDGGSIHIAPSKRGTFTAAAKRHGKSVQEFASQVLANKDNYPPAIVKKANFARNAAGWKHDDGGGLTLDDVLDYFWKGDREGFEAAKQQYENLQKLRQAANNYNVVLPEITVTPDNQPAWTSEDLNNLVYKKTPKTIHYNDYQGWQSELATQKDPLGKIAGAAIGLPLIASSPVVPALLEGSLNSVKEGFKAMDFLYSPSKWLNPVTGNRLFSPVLGTSADATIQSAFVTEGLQGLYDLYKNGTLSNYDDTAQNVLMMLPIVGPAVSSATNGIKYATPYLQAMQRGVRNKLGSRKIADTPWLFTDISDINPYGHLNFYRLIEGLPIIKDGKVLLGKEGLGFVNFTTDLPFRLHKQYSHVPGGELMVINGGKLQGKTPISIEPMDSFFLNDIQLNPNLITIATGNKDLLKQGKKLGFNMITSEELLKNYPKEQTQIDKFTKTGFGYREGAKLYKQLLDEFVTKTFGRPTLSDYKILENKTGLKASVEKYINLLDEISKLNSIFKTTPAQKLPTHYVYTLPNKRELGVIDIMYPSYRDLLNYKNVFYDPVTNIELDLTKKLGFSLHPKNSEELVKAIKDYIKINSIKPLSTGGPLYPFSFSKIPYIKTPIVRY